MYKGYTNEEIIKLFRDESNTEYRFPVFMDLLKEKVCQDLKNTSEVISQNALACNSIVPSLDSLVGASTPAQVGDISESTNSTSNREPLS